ncbi:MAG: TolC family outer membrane protein [Arenicellales bacterium]
MIRSILRAAFPAALLLCSTQVFAEDLVDIYNAAVQNDPQYQAQTLNLKAEQEGPASARAGLLPQVNLFATRARNHDKVSGSAATRVEGSASYDSNQYGASVTQPIYDREKLLNYEQSKLSAQVAETDFKNSQQQLILRVVDRYFGILAAQDNLELAIAERRAINRQLELAHSRLDVGLGTTTDLYDARARFALAQAQEIKAQQAVEDANQAMQELIGHRVENLAALKDTTPLTPPKPDDPEVWAQRAQKSNPALIAAGLNEEISRREVSRQKSRRFPTLDLMLSHNVQDDSGSIGGGEVNQDSTSAMLQLQIPIFQGGGITADSRAAAYRYEAAQQQTESARRSAARSARSAYLNVTTSVREVNALDEAVLAGEKALESRQEGFQAGLNTNLDVLNAQRDLYQAKRNYLQSRYQYISYKLQLYSVAGELNIDDLQVVNGWLK